MCVYRCVFVCVCVSESTDVCVFVLLEVGDELLLGVQFIPQVADLLLVALSVGLDLLLHGILTHTHTHVYHHRNHALTSQSL